MRRGIMFVLAAVLLAGAAWAQSLGEVAERERQKQKEKKTRPPRVYTDQDLPRPTPTPEGAPPPESTAAPAPPNDGSEDESSPRPDDQRREWQQRAADVRDRAAQARQGVAEAQARVDTLKSPYHVLHPYGHGNPEVPAAEADLARAKEALKQVEAELAAFEKEAARARVPPRWLEPQ